MRFRAPISPRKGRGVAILDHGRALADCPLPKGGGSSGQDGTGVRTTVAGFQRVDLGWEGARMGRKSEFRL